VSSVISPIQDYLHELQVIASRGQFAVLASLMNLSAQGEKLSR